MSSPAVYLLKRAAVRFRLGLALGAWGSRPEWTEALRQLSAKIGRFAVDG